MYQIQVLSYIWISSFLVICSCFDLYSSKIPNKFIVSSFVISLITLMLSFPNLTLLIPLQSFLIMFTLGFLLFKFKILGGGDIKTLCIVSLFLAPQHLQHFLSYSLIWAGAYAIIFYLISGQIFKVLYNTFGVYKKFTQANHKIPFTFGILLGWFSLFTLGVLSW